MGRYDDIEPEDLRQSLVRVARLILRLEEDGELLREAPRLQKLLGDLRQRLFAYEVRSTAKLGPQSDARETGTNGEEKEDPLLRISRRIVEEARKREEKLREELEGGEPSDDDE
ncbi:MAG: hypothetical protein GWM92_10955 [Gemmatimonadetes bacterium]|nr:hypothetical protein [Gemmatimonadota bacterium]NIR79208.1 hypothetical protein [Gemmatimonadota bacterium]NIT87869.1 hypothetical protein [Gemmatimonadota bacterium]NIU31724.1 hypothetical protein [Gemmatimonadota bacterium]NIU36341.1 hypothetical protein [Gemmatimonadota bacterium]